MSLKVTGCSKWELWVAGLTGEGRGSECLGWVRGSLPMVEIGGQSWGGCVELAETLPWHREVNRQLMACGLSYAAGSWIAVGPALRGGDVCPRCELRPWLCPCPELAGLAGSPLLPAETQVPRCMCVCLRPLGQSC